MTSAPKRILMAKTGLDGHWRGPTIVARALRDAQPLLLADRPPSALGVPLDERVRPARPDEVLTLANAAVSTSGDLYQSVEIDGVRYSHILDPATGTATFIVEVIDVIQNPLCELRRKVDRDFPRRTRKFAASETNLICFKE